MAIRGWWCATGQAGTGADTLTGAILTRDEDVSTTSLSLDPADVNTYVDEDILHTFGWAHRVSTEIGSDAHSGTQQLNVKARRKLRSGTSVSVVLTTTNDEIGFNGVFRGLLKVS